jgi:hypothetical protein
MLEQLLDQLFQSRERLLMSLELLPEEALWQQGVVGEWSLIDLLNVLTAWESELVTAMMRLEKGQKPDNLLAAMADENAFNARVVKQGQTRDLEAIFDDFQGARMHLEEWLEFFTERQLMNPKQYKWFQGRSLAQIIETYSAAHERSYLPAVELFAQSWRETADTHTDIIPLSAVRATENKGE